MQTKSIAIVIVFAALAITLNPIKIPSFFSGFQLRIYEIPIVIAFMLFGFKIGFSIQILHLFGQMLLFSGRGIGLGYITGLLAVLSMILGLYMTNFINARSVFGKKIWSGNRAIILFTAMGTLFRGVIAPILDYLILYNIFIPITIGSYTQEYILSLMPGVILFNIIVPLYTIPISYYIAKRINKNFKILGIRKNGYFWL